METFSLTLASGWQRLKTLLETDATFKGKFIWQMCAIRNTHSTATMIIKSLPGTTAPSVDSGWNLPSAGGNFTWSVSDGLINGEDIWIKASAAGSCDITIIKFGGA